MKYNKFGDSDIKTSVLGFGAGHIGDERMPDNDVEVLVNQVVDCGINLIDTARGYGVSEDRIGKFLSHRRKDIVICTKIGYGIQGHNDWTYSCIIEGINEALRKMRTDYIDIVLLHSCNIDILRQGEVIRALEDAKNSGKVRVIGYSGENAELDFALNVDSFEVIMCSINFCEQKVIDWALPRAIEKKKGVIAKRPIANYCWKHSSQPHGHYCEEYWKRWQAMSLNNYGYDWNELALRFVTNLSGVSSCIVGTANIEHLKENIRIVEKGFLPDDIFVHIRDKFIENDNNWIGQI
ncbi:MAG: aldo/keto reductase [Spirochaetes bacterium GWD1_27_9]|nr:MAG: aldo/keto reductase [Spirochaetes bacterium GWB1_27_13]OHD26510.1 MAG: aldo/keto reductase [Spirochaetes bacterium GWC1_27_15]OHD44801.1 MAG: aldo/keto reductase [Spirochaetes bacterium GWD1_27_9]